MTIQTQTPRVVIIGNGTRGPYSLVDSSAQAIRFVSTSHLKLTRYATASDANTSGTVLVENTDYTVGGTEDARTFTLASGQAVLTSNQRIVAERVQSYTQDLNLTNGGAFNAEAVEARLNKIVEFQQELKARLDRVPTLQFADATANVAFPGVPSSLTLLARSAAGAIVHAASADFGDGTPVEADWMSILGDAPGAGWQSTLLASFSALDDLLVHKAGEETVSGAKLFSGKQKFGETADDLTSVNPDVPGGIVASFTKSSTAVADGNYYLNQGYFIVNPGSNQASGCDHRTARFETESRGTFNIFETVGGSYYNFHRGSGTLDTAYGGTNQFFNQSTGVVTSAYGGQGAVWNNGEGRILTGYGVFGVAASYRDNADLSAIANGWGVYGEVSQRGDGILATTRGIEGRIWVDAAGSISTGQAVLSTTDITHASGTISNGYGFRTVINNAGTLTTFYHAFFGSISGTAAGTEYAIYSQTSARSYHKGRIQIGTNSLDYSGGKVVIDQDGQASALELISTDGGTSGPTLRSRHDSASPANNDVIFVHDAYADDDAGLAVQGMYDETKITSVATTATTFERQIWMKISGTLTQQVGIKNGVIIGSPTGGYKGSGALNAVSVYDDNTLLSCYPFQQWLDGKIDVESWDEKVANRVTPEVVEYEMEMAPVRFDSLEHVWTDYVEVEVREPDPETGGERVVKRERAIPIYETITVEEMRPRKKRNLDGSYVTRVVEPEHVEVRRHEPLRYFMKRLGTKYDPMTIEGQLAHVRDKRHLTAFPNEAKFDPADALSVGSWHQRMMEMMELQFIYITELHERLSAVEGPGHKGRPPRLSASPPPSPAVVALEGMEALRAKIDGVRKTGSIDTSGVDNLEPLTPDDLINMVADNPPGSAAELENTVRVIRGEARRRFTELLNVELSGLEQERAVGSAHANPKREQQIEYLLGLFARLGEI